MLTVLLTLVVVAVALGVVLWIGAATAQGYFYDAPTDGLVWRAPAAAAAITVFLLLWSAIEYRSPRSTDPIFEYTSLRSTDITKVISVKKTESGEKEIAYELRHGSGRPEFRDEKGAVWTRSSSGMMVALIIEEDGEQKRFSAKLVDGKFAAGSATEPLRYVEDNGRRYIIDNQLGKVYGTNRSALPFTIFLNVAHLLVWFAVLWPLLRFQWSHALGFAAVCWLLLTLALLPFLFGRARDAGDKKAKNKKPMAMLRILDQPPRLCFAHAGQRL